MKLSIREKYYKAFGLRLLSEIPFPELPQISKPKDAVDIEVRMADLTGLWLLSVEPPRKSVIKENLVMFQIPDTAIFCIEEGKRIIVSPVKGYDEDELRLFILGTCMGAVLMQRKILTLHGSAIAIDGMAYGFIGDSGAGKSTLASAFLNKGYQLLSDDIIAVSFSPDYTPLVMPAYPQQKLWEESLQQFGLESDNYRPIYQRETKFAVPVLTRFYKEPLPLAGVIELVKGEDCQTEIRPIQKLKRLQTLFHNTYRNFLIPHSGLSEWHFNTCVNIANHIDIYQLRRPTIGFTAPQMVNLILSTLRKEAS